MRHAIARRLRGSVMSIGAALSISLLVGSVPVAAAPPGPATTPTIQVLIHGTCVDGQNYQAGGTVKVVQKRGSSTIATSSFGASVSSWSTCLKTILAGDRLVVKETVASSVVSNRTVTVPALAVSLDATNDTESGHAPNPGSLVNPGVDQMVAGLQAYSAAKGVLTDGSGNFNVSWTGFVTIRAGDVAVLFWNDPAGDTFRVTSASPSLGVEVGKSAVAVTGPYGHSTTARLRTAAGVLRATATGAVSGTHSELHATFKSGGSPVKVKAGDRVTSSQIPGTYKVRASDVVVHKAGNGSLTATCAPGSDYIIFINGVWSVGGLAGVGGAISNSNVTNGHGPLTAGSSLQLACRLPSGFGQVFTVKVK